MPVTLIVSGTYDGCSRTAFSSDLALSD